MENTNKNKIAADILSFSADSLAVEMRALSHALSVLEFIPDDTSDSLASDGKYIYFNPDKVISDYLKDKLSVNKHLLHSLFHCIFGHIFKTEHKDRLLWDLACDISVEYAVYESNLESTKEENNNKIIHFNNLSSKVSALTAENLYYHFLDCDIDEVSVNDLCDVFSSDCHKAWYRKNSSKIYQEDSYSENGETPSIYKRADDRPSGGEDEKGQTSGDNSSRDEDETKEIWERVSKKIALEAEFDASQRGNRGSNGLQELKEINYCQYDYSEFLRQFSIIGEAIEADDNEFDYIYYTYGMKLYKNLPLIEPLEYCESNKIRDFVIAIDTSGSVHGETVQKFLEKTYHILKNSDSFFENFNIHIIQCDAAIQDDSTVHNEKELNKYISEIKLHGFGGTDFRPIFEYTDRLIENKTIENLRGLIYFTDGDGIFPKNAPKYKTAFILNGKNIKPQNVPSWACKMILRENELWSE